MGLFIPDETLRQLGLEPREALIEFACRMLVGGKLEPEEAASLAGLDLEGLEDEVRRRGLAEFVVTADQVEKDLDALRRART